MTTELEKQFFDTFGIEPKLNSPCEQLLQNKYCKENSGSRDTYFDPFPYCVGFENCTKDYKERVWGYPKITDRIYLELHCLLNSLDNPPYGLTVKEFKKDILISAIGVLSRNETAKQIDNIKHQVQALFKEGK